MLTHLHTHGGRIDVTDPGLAFRRATLAALPNWWAEQSRQVAAEFRPPTPPTE